MSKYLTEAELANKHPKLNKRSGSFVSSVSQLSDLEKEFRQTSGGYGFGVNALRLGIILLFGIAIAATTLPAWRLTLEHGKDSAEKLANSMMDSIMNSIERDIDNWMSMVGMTVNADGSFFRNQGTSEVTEVELFIATTVYIATPENRGTGYTRVMGNVFFKKVEKDLNGTADIYTINDAGAPQVKVMSLPATAPGGSPNLNPGYLLAANKPVGVYWTPIAISSNNGGRYIEAACPLYNTTDHFIGVSSYRFSVGVTTKVINDIELHGGFLYIVEEESGMLVGTSSSELTVDVHAGQISLSNDGGNMTGSEFDSLLVNSTTDYFLNKYESWSAVGDVIDISEDFNNVTYYLESQRLKLDGLSTPWRAVLLIPRDYFMGTIEDGEEDVSTLVFVISGIVLIVAVIVAVVLTVPIGHTLELKRQQGVVLAKVNQQRKQMMEISQDLSREKLVSDALLFQIFPATVIETLRKGEPVEPVMYPSVTLLFTDVVGFTALTLQYTPQEVITLLNDMYFRFDDCIEQKYPSLYKLETSGDAWLAIGGAPVSIDTHAAKICYLSLDLIKCMEHVKSRDGKPVSVRIGVHSGQVVAGVMGRKQPRWTLQGADMNVCARLEQTSEPGKVQISSSTNDLLTEADGIEVQSRGLVELKGRGQMETFFLVKRTIEVKAEGVSIDAEADVVPVSTGDFFQLIASKNKVSPDMARTPSVQHFELQPISSSSAI